jgi:hypothetical protein
VSLSGLQFSTLAIYLHGHEEEPWVLVEHAEMPEHRKVRYVDLGDVSAREMKTVHGELRWDTGSTLVLGGRLACEAPGLVEVQHYISHLSLSCSVRYPRSC